MTERSLTFGSVAAAYERFRPGYPDALVDEVLAYAGRHLGTALEVGAGTGKATRVFASRGIAITATEPDAAMLAELVQHVPESVVLVQAPFEELALTTTYDLVYAAAAMHWTRTEGRWERVAALLVSGGVFASFGGPLDLADPDMEGAVRAARAPFLTDDDVPSPDGTPADSPMQWPGTELTSSDLFAGVQQRILERRTTMSRRDYVGLLSTISAYLELTPADRATTLGRIYEVLPEHVEVTGDITLHLARKV